MKRLATNRFTVPFAFVAALVILAAIVVSAARVSIGYAQEYGGYFVLGDFNGFTYEESDEFASAYKLTKNENGAFDEYELTLTVTQKAIADFDGVEFYISDGATDYKNPSGGNIKIAKAGVYELCFSPDHDYGRGYRYRLMRRADDVPPQTVNITTVDEFNAFAAKCISPEYSLNTTVIIKNSLDFSGKTFTPITVFSGSLDGQKNALSGITVQAEDISAYLIGILTESGSVKNAELNVNISGGDNVAPIAECYGSVDGVKVSGVIDGERYVGGLVGSLQKGGVVTNCASTATVNGLLNVGGLVGFNAGEVSKSENSGAVNNKVFASGDARRMLNVGGICGYATGNIFECKNSGDIGYDQSRYFGGIAGLSSGGIYFCTNSGIVGAENYAGGIVGYYGRIGSSNDGSLSDYLSGSDLESWLDGLFGSDDGDFEEAEDTLVREIYYCHNTGSVKAEYRAGGIAGYASATGLDIVGCVSSANITAGTSHVGGIAGEIGLATVSGCVSSGIIITQKGAYSGGIVGESGGVIEYCTTSAYVESETGYVGGIAGSAATVRNCVSHAYVKKTNADCGMIAGAASSYEYNFYPSGTYSGTDEVKGINGINYGHSGKYGACELELSDIVSQGTLSPELYGLSADHWLAGEREARFPVPRVFTDMVSPLRYAQNERFKTAFEGADEIKKAADAVGAVKVTVTFFEYDFDNEKYELLEIFHIAPGSGVEAPKVPEKDGYFTWWDRTDFTAFTTNTEVKMQFDKYVTSLASDDTVTPLVIVTGKFHSGTVLKLEYSGEYITLVFERNGERVSYGKVGVRYAVEGADVTVSTKKDGEVKTAEFTVDGGYAIFSLDDGEAFCVSARAKKPNVALIVSMSILGAVVIALSITIPLVVKRRRRTKNEK